MRLRRGSTLAGLLALLLAATLSPASGQSLQEARAQRAETQRRLDDAAAALATLEADLAALADEREALRTELAELEGTVDAASERIETRVRALYMHGSGSHPVIAMFAGDDPEDALQRADLVQRLVAGDLQDTEVASNGRIRAQAVQARLAEREEAMAVNVAQQEQVMDQLEKDLAAAARLEARLEAQERARREAEARRRAAAAAAAGGPVSSGPAPVAGGRACPVARPHSFTDTWGAPRSGGRRHKGTDILAPRGQAVIAIVSGVWDVRSYGATAGHWGLLRGDDGNHYYYMHLQSHVVGDGARVAAGQQVATNGDTGNARGTPHVHFELHPGGGSPINPYPTLRAVCG